MGYIREVEISAPVDRVWNAWTSSEEAQKWLAPRANVFFEKGGEYEFFWNEDPEIDSTLGCKLLAINPGERLAFEWQGKKEFLHMFKPPEGSRTIIEVRFISIDGETQVIVNQEETRNLPQWEAYDSWMASAWELALASLKSYCEGKSVKPYWQE
jgi:uncharacterized protein YndB with AHSA1/START domain